VGKTGVPKVKEVQMQPSAGKVMATVFWDAKGVIILGFLPKRSTITGLHYANLLKQLRTTICEICQGKLSKGVLLQQNNAKVQTYNVAMDDVEQNRFELKPHADYLPNLTPFKAFLLLPILRLLKKTQISMNVISGHDSS
jgi:hypothetical protein